MSLATKEQKSKKNNDNNIFFIFPVASQAPKQPCANTYSVYARGGEEKKTQQQCFGSTQATQAAQRENASVVRIVCRVRMSQVSILRKRNQNMSLTKHKQKRENNDNNDNDLTFSQWQARLRNGPVLTYVLCMLVPAKKRRPETFWLGNK